MQTMLTRWLGVFALLLVSGCAGTQYTYQPVDRTDAILGGHPAADYAVPTHDPKGDVRIASLGLSSIRAAENAPERKALTLRMVVSNDDDAGVWQFDVRAQQLSLGGGAPATPDLVISRPQSAEPIQTVPPASQKTVDLYFSLPSDLDTRAAIPAFDLLWQIDTPEGRVAERTAFERLRLEPFPDSTDAYSFPGVFAPYAYWEPDPFWPPVGLRAYYLSSHRSYKGHGRPRLDSHEGGP